MGDWERHRTDWSGAVDQLLGELTDVAPSSPDMEVVETQEETACTARLLRYRLTDREWGHAWLLTPHGVTEPRPAIIALHQTVPWGKAEPVGLEGDPALAYGRDLAERGYVVLAPDAIGFGDRATGKQGALYHSAADFFGTHRQGSVMLKMAFDAQRAVDLLATLPEVDPQRIGCIGHSHGGYGTLFAMLYEPRIKAGVISCGITAYRTDPFPDRWWRKTALIPRLGLYEGDMPSTPFDFHQLVALVAPRPLFVSAALGDSIFPNTGGMSQLLERARAVYRLYGAGSHLKQWIFQGSHRFPRESKTRAYRMFEETL
jgi:dienelactone hydrolase